MIFGQKLRPWFGQIPEQNSTKKECRKIDTITTPTYAWTTYSVLQFYVTVTYVPESTLQLHVTVT